MLNRLRTPIGKWWGDPWHGLCRNDKIELPNGARLAQQNPGGDTIVQQHGDASGDVFLVRVPNTPAVVLTQAEQSEYDAQGIKWLDYGLISGYWRMLWGVNMGIKSWIFAGTTANWLMRVTGYQWDVQGQPTVTVTAKRFGVIGQAEAAVITRTVSLPELYVGHTYAIQPIDHSSDGVSTILWVKRDTNAAPNALFMLILQEQGEGEGATVEANLSEWMSEADMRPPSTNQASQLLYAPPGFTGYLIREYDAPWGINGRRIVWSVHVDAHPYDPVPEWYEYATITKQCMGAFFDGADVATPVWLEWKVAQVRSESMTVVLENASYTDLEYFYDEATPVTWVGGGGPTIETRERNVTTEDVRRLRVVCGVGDAPSAVCEAIETSSYSMAEGPWKTATLTWNDVRSWPESPPAAGGTYTWVPGEYYNLSQVEKKLDGMNAPDCTISFDADAFVRYSNRLFGLRLPYSSQVYYWGAAGNGEAVDPSYFLTAPLVRIWGTYHPDTRQIQRDNVRVCWV